jgi:hypothetical protein
MRAESVALLEVLVTHHRATCRRSDRAAPPRETCLITYGALCQRAGVPNLTRVVGQSLLEVAQWCEERALPPINSLAVNAETRMPGENYDVAPNCSLLDWPADADACIRCRDYPARAQ